MTSINVNNLIRYSKIAPIRKFVSTGKNGHVLGLPKCQLKMLLALLAESQRVAYQVGCAGKGRIRLIRNLARRVEEDMMKEVKETCLPLLLEIAACGLFRLPATTIQHRTANSGSSADVLRFQGKSADAIGEPLLCN